jgi:predicted acyl esterase
VEKVPVILAWSPYGKGQGTSLSVMGVFALVGLSNEIVSGLEKFEGADPAYWCAKGYAICNPDIRGVVDSEGDSVLWDRQDGRDCYDLIEWLAEQEWCSGKVAMSGTSYLAVSQWFTAAEQPPHLAAINPWEGVSDVYRDLVMRGGMPDIGFARQLQDGSFFGKNRKEDILSEVERYPLVNDLWENKIPNFDQITVPAYVVASYSNTLHTTGTFRAWRRIASDKKWLRIHNSQEWPDYYDEENREDLRRFFDHYLKDEENGWEQTPRVRYSLLDLEGMFGWLPASGLYVRHVHGLSMRDVSFSTPVEEWRPTVVFDDVQDLRCSGLQSTPAVNGEPMLQMGDVNGAWLSDTKAPQGARALLKLKSSKDILISGCDLRNCAAVVEGDANGVHGEYNC